MSLEEIFSYFVMFLLAYFALAIIVKIFKGIFKISKNHTSSSLNKSNNRTNFSSGEYRISDFEGLLSDVLDNTFLFIDSYRQALPDEWLFIHISTVMEKNNLSSDYYSMYDEYLLITLTLGNWWDKLLYKDPESEDYMKTVFTFVPDKNEFVYKQQIAFSSNRTVPTEEVKKRLFAALDDYEKKNPTRKLTKTQYGATQSWNLSK